MLPDKELTSINYQKHADCNSFRELRAIVWARIHAHLHIMGNAYGGSFFAQSWSITIASRVILVPCDATIIIYYNIL